MNAAAIVCCHCGRDYAREYWALLSGCDPNVCNSCRRDTNPDAADAPRWTPAQRETEERREAIVTEAKKQCRVCGGVWDGLIFGPPPGLGLPLPFGICPACSADEDLYAARLTAKIVPMGMSLPELSHPQRVTEDA